MNKNKLTIIACSGSILAATLFATSSYATPQQNFGDGNRNRQVIDGASLPENRFNTPSSTENFISPLSYERRLQQTALTKLGCGCNNCVSAIRKLVRAGELSI
jgi:hypothetical protein